MTRFHLRWIPLLFAVMLMTAVCDYDDDGYVLKPREVRDRFKLESAGPSMPADGFSRMRLTATITSEEVGADSRTIVFTTTEGTFTGTGGAKTLEVRTNESREASAELRSSRIIGTVRVQASIKELPQFVRVREIRFEPVEPDSIIRFVDPPDSLAADGFTATPVAAVISRHIEGDARKVKFTTTAGTYAGADNEKEVEVEPDASGLATAILISPAEAQRVFVHGSAYGVTREAVVEFVAADPDGIMRFLSPPDTADADGATLNEFSVVLSGKIPAGGRKVTFATTYGVFAPGGETNVTVPADDNHVATAWLRSPNATGDAIVNATIGNLTRTASITFEPALPTTILVVPSTFVLKGGAGEEITVDAYLRRDVGSVTPGTLVTFAAADSVGAILGNFRGTGLSDESGKATTYFSVGANPYRGPCHITASVDDAAASGTATIQIIDP